MLQWGFPKQETQKHLLDLEAKKKKNAKYMKT